MAKWAVEYGVPEMFHSEDEGRVRHTIIIKDSAKERDYILKKCKSVGYPVYGYRALTKEEVTTRTLKRLLPEPSRLL